MPTGCISVERVRFCASSTASTGSARNAAASATAASLHIVSATSAARASSNVAKVAPLWTIAPASRPRDIGDASTWSSRPPPADSPNATTRAGSPPKEPMWSRTHSSAHERVPEPAIRDAAGGSRIEKAERAQAEVHRHDDDRLLAGQQRAVVDPLR